MQRFVTREIEKSRLSNDPAGYTRGLESFQQLNAKVLGSKTIGSMIDRYYFTTLSDGKLDAENGYLRCYFQRSPGQAIRGGI